MSGETFSGGALSTRTKRKTGKNDQKAGGPVGKKLAMLTNQRLDRIERYLQDRFNWDNIPSPKKTNLKDKILKQRISDEAKSNASSQQALKYQYVVNMTEKPQDPGTVN